MMASPRSSTVTPGSTAPVWSVTVPTRVPVVRWAKAGREAANTAARHATSNTLLRIALLLAVGTGRGPEPCTLSGRDELNATPWGRKSVLTLASGDGNVKPSRRPAPRPAPLRTGIRALDAPLVDARSRAGGRTLEARRPARPGACWTGSRR